MAHNQEVKNNVLRLYVEGMALKSVAINCDVSYETARSWKYAAKDKGDDWETARTANVLTGAGIGELNNQLVEHFARQAVTTMRELEAATNMSPVDKVNCQASLSDAYAKFSKAFSRVNPRLGALSVSLDTLKVIADYLQKRDKATLHGLQNHIEDIGAILQERYGKSQ